MISALPSEEYETRDIFIDRQGRWHVRGMPVDPHRALSQLDVALNAVHGDYGEDGTLGRLLESHRIPYAGSDPFASATMTAKHVAKEVLRREGVQTPYSMMLSQEEVGPNTALHLFRSLPQPSIIKPVNGSSSLGVSVARDYFEFEDALGRSFFGGAPALMIEEYIPGREATVGTIERFRDEDIYTLPPVEVALNPSVGYFDYAMKCDPAAGHKCPGGFASGESQELRHAALVAHQALGMRHFGRHDFVMNKRGVIYYIESNPIPEMNEGSTFSHALSAVGATLTNFYTHVINLVLGKR